METTESLKAQLSQLELRMTHADVRRSRADLGELLADDFREFGSSGRVFDKGQIIEALQKEQPGLSIQLEDFQAITLAEDVVLLTYRGTCKGANSDKVSRSLRTSIWRRLNGQWQVVFHQGTVVPVTDPAMG